MRVLLGFSDQRSGGSYYSVVVQEEQQLLIEVLPLPSESDGLSVSGSPASHVSRLITGRPCDIRIAVEDCCRAFGVTRRALQELARNFPYVAPDELTSRDIFELIDCQATPGEVYPLEAQYRASIKARAGFDFRTVSWEAMWTAAVGLAGAELAWGRIRETTEEGKTEPTSHREPGVVLGTGTPGGGRRLWSPSVSWTGPRPALNLFLDTCLDLLGVHTLSEVLARATSRATEGEGEAER